MKRNPWVSISLAGVNICDFGAEIPSPYVSLKLENSQIQSFTNWELEVIVGGDANRRMNVAAFEALLYSSAQSAYNYSNASGIPVSFMFGWIDEDGAITDYTSYQGYTLKFDVNTSGIFLTYTVTGYASIAIQSSLPVLNIPALSGIVQPSAVVEALATGIKATSYYQLDIDHTDSPTLVNHGAMTTSFVSYVRGEYSAKDDYSTFPGLLKLAKSYNGTRTASGIKYPNKNLSTIMNNAKVTPIKDFLKPAITDNTPQSTSFSFWIDEPTMTKPGVIHFKNNQSLAVSPLNKVLEYGTANTNVISISGSYNGVAYNMTNLDFGSVGFAVDGSGNAIVTDNQIVNSWSNSLAQVFQTSNIINDANTLASQFSGNFTVDVPGSPKTYQLAEPVSLVVMSGNTLSPITGIYSIMSVSHSISSQFTTTLSLQRLVMSSANQTASQLGIQTSSATGYGNAYRQTSNIISPNKVDFGEMYPTFEHMEIM